MVNFQTFLFGLLISSTLTGLATEAVKTILAENNKSYHANTLTGIISMILSTVIGIAYVIMAAIPFTAQIVVGIITLVFMSWLCAMVGYDKVIQAISQFKTNHKG